MVEKNVLITAAGLKNVILTVIMKPLLYLTLLLALDGHAQTNPALTAFKKHAETRNAGKHPGAAPVPSIYNGNGIDYLKPLSGLYANKAALLKQYGSGYYDHLSQVLSFCGDFKSVLESLHQEYGPPDTATIRLIKKDIAGLPGGAMLKNAHTVIIEKAANYTVVMINEAHCKPLHRAFTNSLLDDFYRLGFRYLAMETLSGTKGSTLNRLTMQTGYYTCEPVFGELVRKALLLGFKLVPYEDTTLTGHSPMQRDSIQARNIYRILQRDPAAKILVHAGYGHIAKKIFDPLFVPMAYQFKAMSHIDPLCIDQTVMTEGGNDLYSESYYTLFLNNWHPGRPSVLMQNNKPVGLLNNDGKYDIIVIHPPSTYYKGRPGWYSLYGEKIPVVVKRTGKKVFLVQAYYAREWRQGAAGSLIPADQSYILVNHSYYSLHLKKGTYRVVFRDMNYKVLGTRITVVR